MLSAYCLGYQHFTVIPHQLDESFKDMRDMGFDAVCLTFTESEMAYSCRAFEIQVDIAHKNGLKVFVVPSRLGGRFAGAPLMVSTWVATHPEHALQTKWLPVACLESPEFREWIQGFMTTLLTDYDLDGIIWDEPKEITTISHHPATHERYGPEPTERNMVDSFLDFLRELSNTCQALKPQLEQTLFVQKFNPPEFTSRAAALPSIAYFGYDGNLARQSRFHEEPSWAKYRIESVWDRTLAEAQAADVKTFALVENMLMPKVAMAEFERNFDAYLATYRPDHLSVYYYAHNNEDPEGVQRIVRRLLKKHRG
jgi:hypothetical protein